MAKDYPETVADIIKQAAEEAQPMTAFFSSLLDVRVFNVEASITQMLETNLGHLEALRRSLEQASSKDIDDVRFYGDSFAASLLTGIEEAVDYSDLCNLIKSFKDGIARRRVSQL